MPGKLIVLYHAEWCGPCKRFRPDWEKIKFIIDKLDCDDYKYVEYGDSCGENEISMCNTKTISPKVAKETVEMVKEYKGNIRGFPTLIMFENSKPKEFNSFLR